MVDQETFYCQVCGKKKIRDEVEPAGSIPESMSGVIRKAYPEWSQQGYICSTDLNHFRTQYIREILEEERSELSSLEENITRSMKDHELTAKNINVEFDRAAGLGTGYPTGSRNLPEAGHLSPYLPVFFFRGSE